MDIERRLRYGFGMATAWPSGAESERPHALKPDIKLGFVLSPSFTLLPFAGFLESLRRFAGEGGRSRQTHCRWAVLGADLKPIQSSLGVAIAPWRTYGDPVEFDNIVIVGGLTSDFGLHSPDTFDFLRLAASMRVPVVGLGTGSFAMAEAGLLRGRRCAVHVRHREEFAARYPEARIIINDLFVFDADAITCVGGAAVLDLAIELVMRHSNRVRALKGLVDLPVDEHRTIGHQPSIPYEELLNCGNWRVERAVGMMQSDLSKKVSIQCIAQRLGTSVSQLERDFAKHSELPPAVVWRRIRLLQAKLLLQNSRFSVSGIAHECGFADGSHLTRWFKRVFGETPSEFRRARKMGQSVIDMTE